MTNKNIIISMNNHQNTIIHLNHKPSVFSVFVSVTLAFLYTVKVLSRKETLEGAFFSRWPSFRDGLLFEMGFFSRFYGIQNCINEKDRNQAKSY